MDFTRIPSRALTPGEHVYVVYDRTTGRILHRHTIELPQEPSGPQPLPGLGEPAQEDRSSEGKPPKSMDLDTLLRAVDDGTIVERVSGKDRNNLALLDMPAERYVPYSMVDVKTGNLVRRPALVLTAASTTLNGDGQDKTRIAIEVRDASGAVLKDFSGEVKVKATRGKLSARGGVVLVKGGKGSIELTATNETVDAVFVTARCADAPCAPATLTLKFE